MEDAKQLLIDDAIRVAIEAERKNIFMQKLCLSLSAVCVILACTILIMVAK